MDKQLLNHIDDLLYLNKGDGGYLGSLKSWRKKNIKLGKWLLEQKSKKANLKKMEQDEKN